MTEEEKELKELEDEIERWMEEWKKSSITWYKNFLTISINKARSKIDKIHNLTKNRKNDKNEPGLF